MKTTTFVLILFLTGHDLWAQTIRQMPQRSRAVTNSTAGSAVPVIPALPATPPTIVPAPVAPMTAPAVATPPPGVPANAAAPEVPGYEYDLPGVDVSQVLDVYADLVGRTLLRAGLPQASIVLKTKTKLTKTEAIQALQAVLALNGIVVINVGDKFVKVLPPDQAAGGAAPLDFSGSTNLPELGSYVTHIAQLKYVKPSAMVPIITPFAKLNSIIPIDDNGILVIRDYAENVKRMLEMIDQVDISVPAEYISEVIPIKYALADDIANALNNLGGGGNATISVGSSPAAPSVSGFARPGGGGTTGGVPGAGGSYQSGGVNNNQGRTTGTTPFGAQATTTPNGTAAGGTSTFQQRLRQIIQNASGGGGGGGAGGQQQPIQIFGQAKIIADERSNSLLVFATQTDMDRIKEVIGKLDVLLAQVLIESVIMDVGANKGWTFGVSAAQQPKTLSQNPNIQTVGGINNGQPFFNFLNSISNSFPGNFTGTLPGGSGNSLSYFGNIGPTWDVALQAAASDNSVTVIQRPRIQTSQAKQAQFFVGSTVPYITGTSYGTGFNGANSSQYSQLSVGVELDVTPFINPDGLVVMDINQEIDDISGSTLIDGNSVPNTDKRTLTSEIAVRDRDTIILGGFIRSDKTKTKNGIPLLMDIPLLGNLFSSRSDSKDRQELLVLMRPTVLRTPDLAAVETIKEEERLPGISAASAENDMEERKQVEAERKAELKRAKTGDNGGFFTPVPPASAPVDTNSIVVPNP